MWYICKGNWWRKDSVRIPNNYKQKTKEIVREIDEWILKNKVKEKMDGQNFTLEVCRRLFLSMKMINELSISSKESKGEKALFLQDAERNPAYFKSSSRILHWFRFGKDLEADDLKEKWDDTIKEVTELNIVQK